MESLFTIFLIAAKDLHGKAIARQSEKIPGIHPHISPEAPNNPIWSSETFDSREAMAGQKSGGAGCRRSRSRGSVPSPQKNIKQVNIES